MCPRHRCQTLSVASERHLRWELRMSLHDRFQLSPLTIQAAGQDAAQSFRLSSWTLVDLSQMIWETARNCGRALHMQKMISKRASQHCAHCQLLLSATTKILWAATSAPVKTDLSLRRRYANTCVVLMEGAGACQNSRKCARIAKCCWTRHAAAGCDSQFVHIGFQGFVEPCRHKNLIANLGKNHARRSWRRFDVGNFQSHANSQGNAPMAAATVQFAMAALMANFGFAALTVDLAASTACCGDSAAVAAHASIRSFGSPVLFAQVAFMASLVGLACFAAAAYMAS